MVAVHGKNATFKIDHATGTLTEITSYLDNIEMPREVEDLDATTLGDQDKDHLQGFIAGTITLSGKADFADDAIFDILATGVGSATTRSWEYGPEGTAVGKRKYSGELVILSLEIPINVDEIITFSSNCRVDGAVARGTY